MPKTPRHRTHVLIQCGDSRADSVPPYWVWVCWINPLFYSFRALTLLEFTAPRWQTPFTDASHPHVATLGDAVLESLDLNVSRAWIGATYPVLFCFVVVLNCGLVLAFKFLSCEPHVSDLPAALRTTSFLRLTSEVNHAGPLSSPGNRRVPPFNRRVKRNRMMMCSLLEVCFVEACQAWERFCYP